MPIQPESDINGSGFIEIYPEFVHGMKDLEGIPHIYLLYHFHKVTQPNLIVTPFLDKESYGIFATRAPNRPNPMVYPWWNLCASKTTSSMLSDWT